MLDTFLNGARNERLKGERKDIISGRFPELEEAMVAHCVTIPRDATKECRPSILPSTDLERIANVSSSETVTRPTFAPIVPTLVARWHAEQRQVLQSLLKQFIKKVPAVSTYWTSSLPSSIRNRPRPTISERCGSLTFLLLRLPDPATRAIVIAATSLPATMLRL